MKISSVMLLALSAALSGCYVVPLASPENSQYQAKIVKMTAVGYGSPNGLERYSEGQKKLMAMRASKLDAYRSLAEQVYGLRVTGNTNVGAMATQSDSFRVALDAYIRGARVTSVTQLVDGNFETTVEMEFDESFTRNYVRLPVRTVLAPVYSKAAVGPGSAYSASYYYAE